MPKTKLFKFFEILEENEKTSETNLLSVKLSHKSLVINELTDFNPLLHFIVKPVNVNQMTGFYIKCNTGLTERG